MTAYKTLAFFIYVTISTIAASKTSTAGDGEGEWRRYSQEPNGDVYFFDTSRMKTATNLHQVWSRIRYKRSVMGAASYQSLLEIDCSVGTERILQNTFFSDKSWEKPAMNTDMKAKSKHLIKKGSASERLSGILCD